MPPAHRHQHHQKQSGGSTKAPAAKKQKGVAQVQAASSSAATKLQLRRDTVSGPIVLPAAQAVASSPKQQAQQPRRRSPSLSSVTDSHGDGSSSSASSRSSSCDRPRQSTTTTSGGSHGLAAALATLAKQRQLGVARQEDKKRFYAKLAADGLNRLPGRSGDFAAGGASPRSAGRARDLGDYLSPDSRALERPPRASLLDAAEGSAGSSSIFAPPRARFPSVTTLRAAVGLPTVPPPLSESVLVVIDAQVTYTEGPLHLHGVEDALRSCKVMIRRARELGIPIFHIRHHVGDGTLYDVNGRSGSFAPQCAPASGEAVITKSYPNSFEGTSLKKDLKETGVKNLVLIGFMTHCCISSTARAAFNYGFTATVVADCTATRALPDPTDPTGSRVVAPAAAAVAALAQVSDLHAIVVPNGHAIRDH